MRTLSVQGIDVKYKVGKSNVVFEIPSLRMRFYSSISDVAGRDYSTIERGRYKQTTDGMVTPKDIVRYLVNRA